MSEQAFSQNIPQAAIDWVQAVGKGTLTALTRQVARREAWKVELALPGGESASYFLRLDRNPVPGARVSLEREARICLALHNTDIPAPAVAGWNPAEQLALFEFVQGRSDIDKLDDADQQRAVMEDFIDAIARLHLLPPAALQLDDVLGPHKLSAQQCALDDLNGQVAQFESFLADYHDPLLHYAVQWLRRFAPASVERVSLVQGDTGPVNFMFAANAVTAIVDWEWGHWGDPMEDLGNICVREFWNPSGGLNGLFQRYQRQSGIAYDADAVRYYRVQQNVRGMIPIHAVCQSRGMRESYAWYLAYREVGDRATCEALAQAMGVAIEKPDLPEYTRPTDPLVHAALLGLSRDVAPELATDFARSRATDIEVLVECQHRLHRYQADVYAQESQEISALLGQPEKSYSASNRALCAAIADRTLDDAALIAYLARRAYRREWLFWPVTRLYPARQWSPIDQP
ncbi:MAG: phosphotransferase family protein [Gammaproteobacteria bacterium]|nr:phosphotransferase family protein [Gammaproteobacteria bacterium]